MSTVQVVDLRSDAGPAYRAIANREQRRAYLEQQVAARRAMVTRYAVNLHCSLTMPDGSVLGSLQPVDLALLHASDARAALASGVVMESLSWPPQPRQPWE